MNCYKKYHKIIFRGLFLLIMCLTIISPFVVNAKEQVTIKFSSWWFTEAGHKEWLNSFLDKFEKENPDIKIERIAIGSGDIHDKFMTEAVSGSGPDVLWLRDISLVPFAKMGFLEPLDKYINFKQYQLEEVNKQGIVNGKRYAINVMAFAYGQLLYNKQLLDEAGVQPPKTPEELIQVAKKLTKAPNQYGFGMPVMPSETEYFAQNIQKFACGFNTAISQNGKIMVGSPKFIQSVTWLKKVYDAGVTPQGMGWKVQRRMFADGKIAMLCDGAYQFGVIDGFYPGRSKNFGAVKPPFPGNLVIFNTNFMAVNKNSKYKNEVARFLKWWIRSDNQAEFNTYGLHIGTVKTQYSKEFYVEHPYMEAFDDTTLKPQPTIVVGYDEQSEQIRRTLVDNVAKIFFSNQSVDVALKNAQNAIQAIIKK